MTAESDLDLVGVLDFSSVDFKELYSKLGQKFEPLLVKYASEGKINNVSIVWDEEFEIGLHLWDKGAFEKVVNLGEYNLIFRRKDFNRNFKSTSNKEVLIDLKGEKHEMFKDPKEVEGGSILKFFVYWENESDFYLGIQVSNLLLDPLILCEKGGEISEGLKRFEVNLKDRLRKIYGSSSDEVNLYNAIGVRLQSKISDGLKKKLKNYF